MSSLSSPSAFFRASAAIMARRLATRSRSRIDVQLCGDAHLANFAGLSAPGGALVFDLCDYDETFRGPWEWDVRRLATSVEIAGRDLGHGPAARRAAVLATARSYREAMRDTGLRSARIDVVRILECAGHRIDRRERRATPVRSRLVHTVDGRLRIVGEAPLVVPIEADDGRMHALVAGYREALPGNRRHLLDGMDYAHVARMAAGTGSAWLLLLAGHHNGDALLLQVRTATASALEPCGGAKPGAHGRRVVDGQRRLQGWADPFLTSLRADGPDGVARDLYVRRPSDVRIAAPLEGARPNVLLVWGQLCGWALARAHARGGDRAAVAAHLGADDSFDDAAAVFARAYADENERDHAAAMDATAGAHQAARVRPHQPSQRRSGGADLAVASPATSDGLVPNG